VKARSNNYGYGFCAEKRPDGALVVYTDIPGVTEKRIIVPIEKLEVVRVATGTRVWLKGDPYGWHAGEISDVSGFDDYYVRVPGLTRNVKLRGDRFVVRWNRPLADPVRAVASGLCDSPEYYEARRAFRDQLLRQRSASRGFTAVLSAAIELYPHQLDTVARVLSDPVLRYLLADEVGLGKTIEAGLVMRQLLLDDPRATALVAVPAPLIQQWQDELRGRLLLGHHLSIGRIRLVTHERLVRETRIRDRAVVVIDEAHRVLPYVDEAPRLRGDLLATKGLLLLSATPMRGHLRILLGLLDLIDPMAFPRDDIESFEARIAARESEATSLEVLTSNRATAGQRANVLRELLVVHGIEPALERLVSECRAATGPEAPAWSALVGYVRETYRISRRMVRHRRDTDSTEDYPVAGRKVRFVPIEDPARSLVDAYLDQYRELLDGDADPVLFGRMIVHGLGGPGSLLRHLERRLDAPRADELFVPERERDLFRITAAKIQLADTEARLQAALDVAADQLVRHRKVVVVGTSAGAAQAFYAAAHLRWGSAVFRHMGTDWRAHEDNVARFLGARGGAVLVGDHTVEEGRNLQDAHVLVNLDLPLDPNRLEQRIGRLDRFARRVEPAEVVVLTEPSSEWVTSHVRLLDEGIGIFTTSVATLQRRLGQVLENLTRDLPVAGRDALDIDLPALRESLDEERIDVDLLEELESVVTASDFDDAGVAELRAADADSTAMREAFRKLTSMRGGLALRPVEHVATEIVTFDVAAGGAISGASKEVAEKVLPLLKSEHAYARDIATRRTGVAPLRLGDPLVDWLDQYLRTDERGRARAVVRPYAGVTVPTMWLSCDFLVEFDAAHLRAASESVRRRLRRRGDALLPPAIERTWTDGAGPADAEVVDVLERPYSDRSDRLLKGREWEHVLAELPDWRELCLAAGEIASECLHKTSALTAAPADAAERARTEVRRRLAVLEARSYRLPSEAERESARRDLAREQELGDSLLLGVTKPATSMVACGAIVLWPAR
jgi:ATP-dependent helicase HepA